MGLERHSSDYTLTESNWGMYQRDHSFNDEFEVFISIWAKLQNDDFASGKQLVLKRVPKYSRKCILPNIHFILLDLMCMLCLFQLWRCSPLAPAFWSSGILMHYKQHPHRYRQTHITFQTDNFLIMHLNPSKSFSVRTLLLTRSCGPYTGWQPSDGKPHSAFNQVMYYERVFPPDNRSPYIIFCSVFDKKTSGVGHSGIDCSPVWKSFCRHSETIAHSPRQIECGGGFSSPLCLLWL